MLLGNADIVVPLRKAFMEFHHARALAHGRRDADQAFVVFGHVAQPRAKHLRKSLLWRHDRFLQAHGRIKLARPMVRNRINFSQTVAISFFRHHM